MNFLAKKSANKTTNIKRPELRQRAMLYGIKWEGECYLDLHLIAETEWNVRNGNDALPSRAAAAAAAGLTLHSGVM